MREEVYKYLRDKVVHNLAVSTFTGRITPGVEPVGAAFCLGQACALLRGQPFERGGRWVKDDDVAKEIEATDEFFLRASDEIRAAQEAGDAVSRAEFAWRAAVFERAARLLQTL